MMGGRLMDMRSMLNPNPPRLTHSGPLALVAAGLALASWLMLIMGAAVAQERPAQPAPANAEDTVAKDAATAAMAANADWPCVQHKQPVLTAAQMWDGPPIEAVGKYSDDLAIGRLLPILVSRRIGLDDAQKDIKAFADSLPPDQRDAKLAELFQAVLGQINAQRTSVINGIEKFQRQQIIRARKLEQDGKDLTELHRKVEASPQDGALAKSVEEMQMRYDWDARVFQERQQNVPIACEIPVLIEQRAFAIAQAIRALMNN